MNKLRDSDESSEENFHRRPMPSSFILYLNMKRPWFHIYYLMYLWTTFGWKVKLNIKDNKNVNKVIQYLNNKKEIVHQHINLKIGIVRSLTWMFPILVKSFWMFQPFKCLCCYIIVHKNIIIHKLRKSVFTSLCIAP